MHAPFCMNGNLKFLKELKMSGKHELLSGLYPDVRKRLRQSLQKLHLCSNEMSMSEIWGIKQLLPDLHVV